MRNFADHIAAKKIDQCVALRRAENQPGRAQGRGKVDNGLGGRRTDCVSK